MNNVYKVKKTIEKDLETWIISWKYNIIDLETWEILETKLKTNNYKFKLSNNKKFMKKFIDRKLNLNIKKNLSLLEKEILFDILDYFDEDNIIDFKRLGIDYQYSASKISKAKKWLKEKWLIKEKNKLYYLNPIIGIRNKEINHELIELFNDTFKKYNIEVKY